MDAAYQSWSRPQLKSSYFDLKLAWAEASRDPPLLFIRFFGRPPDDKTTPDTFLEKKIKFGLGNFFQAQKLFWNFGLKKPGLTSFKIVPVSLMLTNGPFSTRRPTRVGHGLN